jgi:uncharacterized protein YjbI with pentapeptide repeats
MMRTVVFSLIGLGIAAALIYKARDLYRNDAMGVRTAIAKRAPGNFEKQDLTGKEFPGAFLPYSNFQGTKLYETMFRNANLQFADFSDADFEMAGVDQPDFSHAIFHGAKLQQARWLDTATYRHASFRNTDLSWVSFHGMYGRHLRSKPSHMMDPGAGGADMTGAVFDGATCTHTIFSRCVLAGASFKGSDCREATFSEADLRNADFTGADLRGAKFRGADTTGAIFTNAKRD